MSLVKFAAKNHPQQQRKRGACDRTNTRCTPDSVFQWAVGKFGPFTLDVAASAENTRCARYYDLEKDGLAQRWSGAVWCNPPFSAVPEWVAKANHEIPNCEKIVMLLPANRTEQRWWQTYVEPVRDEESRLSTVKLTTHFLPGRLEFGPPAADGKGSRPPFGCVILCWRYQ